MIVLTLLHRQKSKETDKQCYSLLKDKFIYPRISPIGSMSLTGPTEMSPVASSEVSRRFRPATATVLHAQFSCSGLQIRTVQ